MLAGAFEDGAIGAVISGHQEDHDALFLVFNIMLFLAEIMVQGALGVVGALVSMYLFSVLGVEGDYNEMISWVGLAGLAT